MVSTEKTKPCPLCQKMIPPREQAVAYPFCSERCQLADLGSWLNGGYAIAGDFDSGFDD